MENIISVHIPKCAGTSFIRVLRNNYGKSLWCNYEQIYTKKELNEKQGIIPQGVRCIHGHFMADTFDNYFASYKLITWVRNPVDRVISNYLYFLRFPDPSNPCSNNLHENNLTLAQFSDLKLMKNKQARFFSGKNIEDFDFVGVTESWNISMAVLSILTPLRCEDVAVKNVNPNRSIHEKYLSDKKTVKYLERNNQHDIEIYKEAVCRLRMKTNKVLHTDNFSASLQNYR